MIHVDGCGIQHSKKWELHQDEGFGQRTRVDLAMALSYVIWEDDMRSPWAKKMNGSCHLLPKVGRRNIKTL